MVKTSETPAAASGWQALLERMRYSLEKRSTLWIFILLLLGFAVRLWRASGTYLNPDEAMHFLAANQTSWRLAYQASLGLAHPPLLVLLLHGLRFLGTSEIVLRMPLILAGIAFCWLSYKWVSILFGRSVAWIVFIFTLFLPSTIDLSTEVRQYALLLAFAMASAYLLERALETNSAPAMLFSGMCLWLAI
jgi:predicted membrane-bound mannosyltransferase